MRARKRAGQLGPLKNRGGPSPFRGMQGKRYRQATRPVKGARPQGGRRATLRSRRRR